MYRNVFILKFCFVVVSILSPLLVSCGDYKISDSYYIIGYGKEQVILDSKIWICYNTQKLDSIYVECWKRDKPEMIWYITNYFEFVEEGE